MGALLVEVADVDAEHVFELVAAEDQEAVKALPAYAPTQRSIERGNLLVAEVAASKASKPDVYRVEVWLG